nr:MAG TPA: hypothetical protein [Caudoviricetes sp.]
MLPCTSDLLPMQVLYHEYLVQAIDEMHEYLVNLLCIF